MEEHETQTIQGVVAVLTAPDGHVVVHAASFRGGSYGPFTGQEAQEERAKDLLSYRIIEELCHPVIPKCLLDYQAREIMRRMQDESYTVTIIPIGYEER